MGQRLLAGAAESVGAAPDAVEPTVDIALQDWRYASDPGRIGPAAASARAQRSASWR